MHQSLSSGEPSSRLAGSLALPCRRCGSTPGPRRERSCLPVGSCTRPGRCPTTGVGPIPAQRCSVITRSSTPACARPRRVSTSPSHCSLSEPALLAPSGRSGSELGQLGTGRPEALLVGPELDEDRDSFLHPDDRAEPVFVVRDLIAHRVVLGLGGLCRTLRTVEGTTWQRAPGRSAVVIHRYQ